MGVEPWTRCISSSIRHGTEKFYITLILAEHQAVCGPHHDFKLLTFPINWILSEAHSSSAHISKMPKATKAEKDADPECLLKSRFSASRLRDIVLGLKDPRKDLIKDRGWGVLLDIGAFSTPRGLLEWIISKIDPELGEFRNARNNTHIVFNKEMVVKALGIPRGTRPVVLTGDHEESPHREFYRIQYKTAGMRAPIYHAAKLLENDDLDDETWFRTFYLVVIGIYFFPGTSSMLLLEYLGSLGDSKLVCEYDWADQIFRHTMSGIKCFQERCRKAKKDGNTNPMWAGGCLPWIAIVYMDHLDFPVSTLSTHRINYAIPRASNISDVDFKFVVKHDKSKMTLIPHTYGVRPFRPFNATPYAIVDAILGNQTFQAPILPQAREVHYSHSGQEDTSQQHTTQTFSSPEGLPDYMKMIQEKYTSLWREDVERLTKLHDKHMIQFASEVFAAIKHNSTTLDGLSSPPGAPTPVASPPRAPTTIISSPQIEQPMFGEDGAHISDPKTTPNTQFWVEASKIADEVELSAGKSANMRDPSSSTLSHTAEESITATARTSCRDYDIECPTFDLLPPGETWTQQFAPNNQQSSDYVRNGSTPRLQEPNITSGSAHLDNHHNHADQNSSAEPAIEKQSDPKSVATTPTTHDGNHSASLALQNSMQAPYTDVSQPSKIGTHTHPAIQKTPAANSTTSKAQTPDDGQYGNSDLHNSQHPPSPKDCQPAKLGIQTRGPI